MKRRTLIILVVIILFGTFAGYAFRSALNPYVSFAAAAETSRTVQVSGALDYDSVVFDATINQLTFHLTDESGTTAKVVYNGAKPNNLEHATSVVVAGRFEEGTFLATRLLVKCPSKYTDGKGS
ncbi:MAG TPA: cytochrome c maturation protein CcmE [Bacillota bacterium]|nr:cytochrome c maturation protein CcmE [Bacillota bacterium]